MKKSIAISVSMLTLVLMLGLNVLAQRTTGDIEGTITDANGAVVPGASVTVVGKDVGFKRTVTTDSDGIYRVNQVPPGNYAVEVAATQGFAAQTSMVMIGLNNTTRQDFKMAAGVGVPILVGLWMYRNSRSRPAGRPA